MIGVNQVARTWKGYAAVIQPGVIVVFSSGLVDHRGTVGVGS